jgi:response regulator RpfG family c-di-GMP phosphodiesterase
MEQMVAPTLDKAIVLRARFNLVWKALSAIEFLSPALILILHRYERYDGADCLFSASGDNIPLGARILAVADTFDAMTSGPSPQGTIDPEMAVQKLIADSGQRFDPHVVSAFAHAQGSEE